MTKRDRKALGKYVRWIADRMGLRDWHFLLDHEPPEQDEAWASIFPTYGQRRAVIHFAVDTRDRPTDTLRRIVVHELMHCHHDRMDGVYRTAAEQMGQQARLVSMESWRSTLENATDDIASAWAESFPLIEWPGASRA